MTDLRFQPSDIEQLPVASLRAYARNPRTHSDDQVAKLAASLVEYGWTAPVMVSDDGEIVAGHGRLLAAQHLGLNEVPIIQLSHLTPEQVRAYRIADNRLSELSGWDDELLAAELHALNAAGFDLGLTGFEGEDLGRLLAPLDDGDGLAGDDVIPEPPVNPVSRPGDLWLLGNHRLLCGDSTKGEDVIRVMNGETAILFATDPPYLVDYDGTNHPSKQGAADKNKDWGNSYGITWDDFSQGPELYEGFIKTAIEHAILPNAAWYCWHASRRQAMVESVWEKFGALTVKVGEKTEHPTSKPIEVFALPMRQHARPGQVCYALSDQVKRQGKADDENSQGHSTVKTNGRVHRLGRLPRPDGLDGQRWRVAHNPTGPAATGVVVSPVR